MISRIAVIFFFTVSANVIASSQIQPKTLSKLEEQKKQDELRKKIKETLDSASSEAVSLKTSENKAFLQVQIACLLWDYDEKGARSLLDDVQGVMARLINDPKIKPPTSKWDNHRRLREDLVKMIAQRDPPSALEFLRNTKFVIPPDSMHSDRARYVLQSEAHLEQQLALLVAQNDPKRAFELAEESLEKGVSSDLNDLLGVVFEKDKAAGQKLAATVLRKLKNIDLTGKSDETNLNAVNFALKLLEEEYISRRPESATGGKVPGGKTRQPVLDDQAFREWNHFVIQASLAMIGKGIQSFRDGRDFSRNRLSTLLKLLPEIEKFSPTLAANFKQRYGQLSVKMDPEAKFHLEIENAKAEEILASAMKSQGGLRREYLQRAVKKAVDSEGNFELARKIIDDHMSDPDQRKGMMEWLESKLTQHRIEHGKIEDAMASIMTLESDAERAGKLADLAGRYLKSGNKKLAAELLEKALGFLPQPVETKKEYDAMIRIIYNFIEIDSDRSFEMFGPLIEPVNQLLSSASQLARYLRERSDQSRDEIPLREFREGLPANGFVEVIIPLSKADFDRAVDLADRFRQPELKLLMKLTAVRAVRSE